MTTATLNKEVRKYHPVEIRRCKRCGGNIVKNYRDIFCLQCGYIPPEVKLIPKKNGRPAKVRYMRGW